jgi:hypothetical protein
MTIEKIYERLDEQRVACRERSLEDVRAELIQNLSEHGYDSFGMGYVLGLARSVYDKLLMEEIDGGC